MDLRVPALVILAAGAGLTAYAVAVGQARVGLLLIVPYLVGTGPLAAAGVGLLFLGVVLTFASLARRPPQMREVPPPAWPPDGSWRDPEADKEVRGGGVILIGPVPIVLGSDRRIALLAALAGVLLLLGLVLTFLVVPGLP